MHESWVASKFLCDGLPFFILFLEDDSSQPIMYGRQSFIHTSTFKQGKSPKSFQVLQTQSHENDESDNATEYFVIMRSIGGFNQFVTEKDVISQAIGVTPTTPNLGIATSRMIPESPIRSSTGRRARLIRRTKSEKSGMRFGDRSSTSSIKGGVEPHNSSFEELTTADQEGEVFLYGYHITPGSNSQSCNLTIISHFSSELRRLEIDVQLCQKLRYFIDELKERVENEDYTRGGLSKWTKTVKDLRAGQEGKVRGKIVIIGRLF